ncbi:hypothetical protein RRG08_063662 [Elysia crispata]|uniref:Uncharacterized protein n=1 Tax=Elysia crispata TaxID=231223 RepID=A0AAE0ZU15_9GAST|nr:hypothetical protein RRG08_063662 [Elysia crispata]
MVYFFNILDLVSVAARVVFKCEFPVDTLSYEENRQKFNLTVARSLVVAQIERRATFPSHHEIIRQNIACVLESICPEPQPAPQQPPAKAAKTDRNHSIYLEDLVEYEPNPRGATRFISKIRSIGVDYTHLPGKGLSF